MIGRKKRKCAGSSGPFQQQRLATRVALVLDGELVEVAPTGDFFNAPRDPRTAAFVSGDLVY